MTTKRLAASVSRTFASPCAMPCTKETTRCTSNEGGQPAPGGIVVVRMPISDRLRSDFHLCANEEAVVERQGRHADRHSGVMAGVFPVELEDEV
jgi:hypothetical protein